MRGSCFFSGFQDLMENWLGSQSLNTISEDVLGNQEYNNATVFFECRNLHSVPSQLKSCCAIRLRDKKTHVLQYRLCYYIWRYAADRDCLQAFVWKGGTNPLDYVPSFFRPDGRGILFEDHFHFVRSVPPAESRSYFSTRFMERRLGATILVCIH
jgi:hypothetical protein